MPRPFDAVNAPVFHEVGYLAEAFRRLPRRCQGADGPATRVIECLDDEHGIVDWPGEDYFATILREYLATGNGSRGRVGQAASELIDADELVRFGARWMTERFR